MKTLLATILFIIALAACGSSPPPKPEPAPAANAREANELALESFEAGRYREAIGGFERAAQLFLSIDDPRGAASAAISEAEVQLLLGETDAASGTLQRARDVIARSNSEPLLARARLLGARIRIESDPGSARRMLENLTATPGIAVHAQMLLCELAIANGDTACASELPGGDVRDNARAEQLRARAAMAEGDEAAAADHLERALNIYRVLAYRPGIAAVHEGSAALATRMNDREASVEHLERALYLRLWIRDRVHAMEDLARLQELSDSEDDRKRYARWQSTLRDEENPEWEALIREMFSSR